MPPTLADIDRYLKARANAASNGTPPERASWQAKVDLYEREHPDIADVAARVQSALSGADPPLGPGLAEWVRQQAAGNVTTAPSGKSEWWDRLVRGFGVGVVAATRALDEEEANGVALSPGQADVRISRLPSRDEIVIRARFRRRDALKMRRVIGRRITAELNAFLDPS